VVDHDTGRLVWAAPGNDKRTLTQFGPPGAPRSPLCPRTPPPGSFGSWHGAARALRRRPGGGRDRRGRTASTGVAQGLKRARWALGKNPENLTDNQRSKLDRIAKTDPLLYKAYLLTAHCLAGLVALPLSRGAPAER
jgi:transposase